MSARPLGGWAILFRLQDPTRLHCEDLRVAHGHLSDRTFVHATGCQPQLTLMSAGSPDGGQAYLVWLQGPTSVHCEGLHVACHECETGAFAWHRVSASTHTDVRTFSGCKTPPAYIVKVCMWHTGMCLTGKSCIQQGISLDPQCQPAPWACELFSSGCNPPPPPPPRGGRTEVHLVHGHMSDRRRLHGTGYQPRSMMPARLLGCWA